MPIKLPSDLPAYHVLTREGVMVLDEDQAATQDIRPLRIALLNLMPKKIQTENQFARLIGAPPLQIEFEHLDFDNVTYWDELTRVFQWTQTNVHSTFGVCWGGMAMINYFHGIKKHLLQEKAFGCFRHSNLEPSSPYLRGFSDDLVVPVSRWTEMRAAEVNAVPGLKTLLGSTEVGPCLVEDPAHRALYIFNHLEYDRDTLKDEYDRDVEAGTPVRVPCNYYPDDDPAKTPLNRWRSHAHLLYGNWINEIYQSTPYDLNAIGT